MADNLDFLPRTISEPVNYRGKSFDGKVFWIAIPPSRKVNRFFFLSCYITIYYIISNKLKTAIYLISFFTSLFNSWDFFNDQSSINKINRDFNFINVNLIQKILILIKSKNHSVLYTKWDFYRREISLKKRIFFKKKRK